MQSIVDTDQDFASSNANLVACLALYQHRQDMSAGINWVSDRTKNLLNYWKAIQMNEFSRLFKAAYYNGIIQQGAIEATYLYEKAKITTDRKELQQLVEKGQACQATIQVAMEQLKAIEAAE